MNADPVDGDELRELLDGRAIFASLQRIARGMDRFAMEVTSDGFLIVNTGAVIPGPPIGTNTTGQEAEGPHCLAGGH